MANKYLGTLKPGYQLYVLDTLTSADGNYQLMLQDDGDLVLNRINKPHSLIWSAGIKGKHPLKAVMQDDGSFVVYDKEGKELWNSGSTGNPGAVLGFAEDGRLTLSANGKTVWKSGRNHVWTLNSGEELLVGDKLTSPNGKVQLLMQADGNLVLYYTDTDDSADALWATGTAGKSSQKVIMQADGNLVVYDSAGTYFWSSDTVGKNGAKLFCQDDGILFIHNYSTKALVWNTGVH